MIWLNHPVLGYGPGTFTNVFPIQNELEDTKVAGWHNDYLQVYMESGLLGLVAMLWLIVTIYRRAILYLREDKWKKHQKRMLLALILSISTILLSSLTGSAFLDPLTRMMFGYLLALVVILLQSKDIDGFKES
jgi:O-antigen ligase